MILVTGANGTTGGEVLRQLAAALPTTGLRTRLGAFRDTPPFANPRCPPD